MLLMLLGNYVNIVNQTHTGIDQMLKKLFMLFKIGRKLSTSGAISSVYEIYNPPIIIKILFCDWF